MIDVGVAEAATYSPTVTWTVLVAVLTPSLTSTVKMVVSAGVTVGFCSVDVNPGGFDVHEYVYDSVPPIAVAFNCEDCPGLMADGVAEAVTDSGSGITVTWTVLVAVFDPSFTSTV